MQENNNQNACDVCGSNNGRCGRCGNMCGFGRNHILRWILGIIIITWIFSIGMKLGELKAELRGSSSYGHKSMMYGTQGAWSDGKVMFTQAMPANVNIQP